MNLSHYLCVGSAGIYLAAVFYFMLKSWLLNERCDCQGDLEMHRVYCKHYCTCDKCLKDRESKK